MSIKMRNLLNFILILCVCLDWGCAGEVTSPSSSCVLSPKASHTNWSLPVVHRDGPCSPLSGRNAASPDDASDILRRDQERVNYINSKLAKTFTNQIKPSQTTDLPAKDGMAFGSASYIVKIGFGTPKHDLSLIFDTGSDLTWIQCKPCVGSCYTQKEPIFNPHSSSSYSNVSFSSPVCGLLTSEGIGQTRYGDTCGYAQGYADGSASIGFLATETFTLKPSVAFNGVHFGCGVDNKGLFNEVGGVFGLGRGPLSFPSQTAEIYKNIFSYCLPSTKNTGHLTFGPTVISDSVKFTPISSAVGPTFFGIDFEGITIDGTKLDIPLTVFSTAGGIIDSGTVITRLPQQAYAALRDAFKEKMKNYKSTSGYQILDTCYDFTHVRPETVPAISFTFAGGTVVDLIGIMFEVRESQVCLAFASSEDGHAVFGSVQQRTLDVVYDVAGGRVGFAPNGCP